MPYNLPVLFDSDRVALARRWEFCRDVFGRNVLQDEMEACSPAPFRVRLSAAEFGAARAAVLSSSPIRNTRNRQLVAHADDEIGFVIPLHGSYLAGHNGAYHPIRPGQLMALSNGISGAVSCPAGGSFLTVIVPRDHLQSRLAQTQLAFGERLSMNEDCLAMLHAYLRIAAKLTAEGLAAGRAMAGQHVVDIMALGLASAQLHRNTGGAASVMAARAAQIEAEIDAHFSDSAFTIDVCATRLKLSVRYVQTILQKQGSNFGAEVTRRRLAMARRILENPAGRSLRITDIAIDCGYSDVSHFNRQFRAAYGDSPSGIRNSRVGG